MFFTRRFVTRLRQFPAACLGLLALCSGCASAQSGGPRPPTPPARVVTVYDGRGYTGRTARFTASWPGSRAWDRRIRSVRVPSGTRVTLYTEPNYRGTETRLTGDWSPESPTAYWVGRARSLRLDRSAIDPPVPPVGGGSSGTLPTIYTQAGYRGRVLGAARDWPGDPDGDRSPFARVGSLRVPSGWRIVAYSEPNYRGRTVTLTTDWAGGGLGFAPQSLRISRPAIGQPR